MLVARRAWRTPSVRACCCRMRPTCCNHCRRAPRSPCPHTPYPYPYPLPLPLPNAYPYLYTPTPVSLLYTPYTQPDGLHVAGRLLQPSPLRSGRQGALTLHDPHAHPSPNPITLRPHSHPHPHPHPNPNPNPNPNQEGAKELGTTPVPHAPTQARQIDRWASPARYTVPRCCGSLTQPSQMHVVLSSNKL